MQASSTDALAADMAALWKYLIRAHGTDFFETVGELDLSFTQVRALSILANEIERATLGELGERIGVSLPAVSRAVEGLVRRGYVTRAEDSEDRRFKRVAATDAGRALMERLFELRVAGFGEFVSTLDPADRERLAAAIAPIVAREEIAALRKDAR
ncbi:MAG TPA: MarR family transcriptional regulator [Thermoleophilaceae bacterium]|nr:MarR family transcriptional regulator [Thermoleophilaceae bacterium]